MRIIYSFIWGCIYYLPAVRLPISVLVQVQCIGCRIRWMLVAACINTLGRLFFSLEIHVFFSSHACSVCLRKPLPEMCVGIIYLLFSAIHRASDSCLPRVMLISSSIVLLHAALNSDAQSDHAVISAICCLCGCWTHHSRCITAPCLQQPARMSTDLCRA